MDFGFGCLSFVVNEWASGLEGTPITNTTYIKQLYTIIHSYPTAKRCLHNLEQMIES